MHQVYLRWLGWNCSLLYSGIGGVPKPTIADSKIDTNKDTELIKKIFNHLDINATTFEFESIRIRKDDVINEKNNPILIKFKELKDKLNVLKNANKLKSFTDHKIFINHDLTDSEPTQTGLQSQKKLKIYPFVKGLFPAIL